MSKTHGFGAVGWVVIVLGSVVGLVLSIVGFYEGRKMYWDYRVNAMCEKDGGVSVVEKTVISAEHLDRLPTIAGSPSIPSAASSGPETPLYSVNKEVVINDWQPRVTRWERAVTRRADGKVVGTIVTYSRFGGDIPTGISEASGYGCPEPKEVYAAQASFFVVEGKTK